MPFTVQVTYKYEEDLSSSQHLVEAELAKRNGTHIFTEHPEKGADEGTVTTATFEHLPAARLASFNLTRYMQPIFSDIDLRGKAIYLPAFVHSVYTTKG